MKAWLEKFCACVLTSHGRFSRQGLFWGILFLSGNALADPPGYYPYPGLGEIHTSVNPVNPGSYYSGWSEGWKPGPSPVEQYYNSGQHHYHTYQHNAAAHRIANSPGMSFQNKMEIQSQLYPNLFQRYTGPTPRNYRQYRRGR